MKKRLLSILSVFACLCLVFTLAQTTVIHASSSQYTADTFAAYMDEWIQLWLSGDMEALEANNQQYESYGMPVTYDVDEEDYKAQLEKAGEFKEYGEASLTEDGDVITVTKNAVCENRTIDFTFSWNLSTNEITWLADMESTPGETFVKACLNTVMGMGTVFVVLIFISFVISLFILFQKGKKKTPAKEENTVKNIPAVEVADSQKTASDDEIIAVIAAAVAAYEAESGAEYEAPADGLFVRSIKKR